MFKSSIKPHESGDIEIIFDQTRQLAGAEYEIYASNNDYVAAYVSLQTALKQQSAKRIIVYSQALQTWLVNGLSKYPFARVTPRKLTYRDLLAAKWNISTYDLDLTDLQIQQQKLLELPVEGTEPQLLSACVCQWFLSPHLDAPQFNRLNFGALMTDLVQYHRRKERLPALATAVYGYKLHLWAAHSPEFGDLIQELQTNLWGLYEQACLYKLLGKYPRALQIKCLGETSLKRLETAKLNLEELDLEPFQQTSPVYPAVLLNELQIFWRSFEKAHPTWTAQQVEELLGYSSGELACEADYLLAALKSRMHLITPTLILRLKTTFRPLLPLYRQKIEEFHAYMPPAKPSPFNPAADIQAVIDWAVQEYLPYKFWLETTRQADPATLAYGRQFSDYVWAHYAHLSYHYDRVLYRFIFNYKSLIAATPFPILLIIDNFNYKFFAHFQAACAQHALAGRVEPYLCLLPSETRSSKKGLISGKRDQADTIQYSYEKTLLENWQAFFPQHTLTYLAKAGELADYVVTGQELLVINYLEIDAELHKSYQKTALEHRQTVAYVLDHLTELLAYFIKRNHLETRARIFLISDHGSTLIPAAVPNEIEPEAFKGQALDSQ
ncbi:PglZ domain protein [Candidatus Vecturithrix granuli]|uniref:PglZ domain protein n=1 Tax=Vecturithrix granuli TaxID=1499967 RepID=A0A081C6I2_VECG1|nr:PglZ domain protein [Candidatus Vecturithrix granuli]